MDGAVEGAVADVVVALLSSSKTASWRLLILSPLALPRLALPRADRGVSLHQQSVWPALALWLKPSPDGLCLGSRECRRLRRPFNDFRRLTGLLREHGLDGLDGLLDLLVAHGLDTAAVVQRHLPRHQENQQLNEPGGLRSQHLVDCIATALPEGSVHFPDGVGVEGVTRALRIPAQVSRGPLLELPVWLSLDDLIGHAYAACFVGQDGIRFSVRKATDGKYLSRCLDLPRAWLWCWFSPVMTDWACGAERSAEQAVTLWTRSFGRKPVTPDLARQEGRDVSGRDQQCANASTRATM